jgi:hypothetical protein
LPKIAAGAVPAFDFTISTAGAKTSSAAARKSTTNFVEKLPELP